MSCTNGNQIDNTIDPPITIGSSRAFEVAVTDETGALVSLAGARGYMTARKRIEDAAWVFRKRTENAGGSDDEFFILPNQTTTDKGRARFYIVPEDTASLDPKFTLVYDVWFVLTTGERKDVVRASKMPLGGAVTRDF